LRSPIASRPCRTAASTSRRSTGDSCFANTHRRRIQGRPRSGDRPRLARRRAQTCSPRARPWNPRSSAAFPEMSFECPSLADTVRGAYCAPGSFRYLCVVWRRVDCDRERP
jgi:hypothetical protein